MEHKGIRYTIVQTASPTGRRWTVELAPPFKSRTGMTLLRATAVRKALAVINNLVLPPPQDLSATEQTQGEKRL